MKRINVCGPFDDDLAEQVVTQIRAAAGQPIDLRIDSAGGQFAAAIQILLEVEEHDAFVMTTVVGAAFSGAGILAIAGDLRRIDRGGSIMLHYAKPSSRESALEMRAILGEYTTLPPDAVNAALSHEKCFSPTEALAANLVDRIVDADAAEPVRLIEPQKRRPSQWLRSYRELFEQHDLRPQHEEHVA